MTKLPLLLLSAATLPVAVFAVTKTNDTNNLNLATSWTGGVAPDGTNTASAGVAQFDTSITGTGAVSYTLGGDVTWGMIRVDRTTATAGSLITITGANTITLNGNTSVGGAGRPDAILLNSVTGSPLQIDSNIKLGGTAGTTEFFTASRNLTINGTVDLAGVNLDAFTAGGTSTYNGAVSNSVGTSNLNKSGAGALVLAGANTYNGSTTVSAGTLTISGTTNGTSSVTVGSGSAGTLTVANGGTLTTAGTLTLGSGSTTNAFNVNAGGIVNAGTLNNAWGTDVTVNGTLNVTNGYTIATNATKSIAGSGTINAASLTLGNAATVVNFTNTGSMNLTGATNITASTTLNQSAGTIKTSGLVVSGAANSYVMTGGRINIGAGGITGTQSASLGAGTVGAYADWSGSLAMTLTNGATGTTFNTLDSVDGTTARTITLSGVLSGATGKLVKSGIGTLTLSGANTYAGGTTVNGGALTVAATTGSIQVGAAGVTVASGATLTVNGTLNLTTNLATIANSGTINGTGVINIGTLFDGDGTSHTYNLISGTGVLSGANFTVTGFSNYSSVTFDNTTGNLVFTAVPEPSTYGLIGAGALAAVAFVRRRRKAAGIAA